jgi:hypothetical protein
MERLHYRGVQRPFLEVSSGLSEERLASSGPVHALVGALRSPSTAGSSAAVGRTAVGGRVLLIAEE